jgi:membrane protease YdiL (CAAX protease family)
MDSLKKLFRQFPLWIILFLLGLRFLEGWLPSLTDWDLSWLMVNEDPIVYLFTVVFIWLNREQLSCYHFDKLAIYIIILFKPLQTLLLPVLVSSATSGMAFPNFQAVLIWIIAFAFFLVMRNDLKKMPGIGKVNWKWAFIGALSGIILSLSMGLLLIPWTTIRTQTPIYDFSILAAFPYQIGYAAISEEPLFRGMLWGQLKSMGWQDKWVWIFQAALFMLAHGALVLALPQYPYAFAIFIGGLVFGALAWRNRSIAPAMLAHGFYNAFGVLTMYFIQALLAK